MIYDKKFNLTNTYITLFFTGFHYLVLLVMACVLMSSVSYAVPYYIAGLVDVGFFHNSTTPTGDRERKWTPPTATTFIHDSAALASPFSSALASAEYYGDLSSGFVVASTNTKNGFDNDVWDETSAESYVEIFDTLSFKIPPGVYANGISISATGHVDGTLSDSYWGASRFSFVASLGSDEFVIKEKNGPSGVHLDSVNENFILTQQLLAPGTVLNEEKDIIKGVRISLGVPMTLVASTTANGSFGPKEKTFASVNFLNTGYISEINTPDGVTWTSASGVFLTQPAPIPVLPSIFLFSSAIGMLGFRLKRQSL